MWQYAILLIIVSFVLFSFYIRLKMPFWRTQPVFHLYDLHHWVRPCGIIDPELPEYNKYVDKAGITTFKTRELDSEMRARVASFIRTNYYRQGDGNYLPTSEDIYEPLASFGIPSLVSVNRSPKIVAVDDAQLSTDYDVSAVITSRPVFIQLKGKDAFVANYVDNLCVDKGKRGKGMAARSIQTLSYDMRRMIPSIKVCLFKREGDMTGIVPIVTSSAVLYSVDSVPRINHGYSNLRTISVRAKGVHILRELSRQCSTSHDLVVQPDINLLGHLLDTGNLMAYGLYDGQFLISAYLFRRPNYRRTSGYVVECIATMNKCPMDDTFLAGFTSALRRVVRKTKCTSLLIENLGSSTLIDSGLKRHGAKQIASCPIAYFFHNYASYSVRADKCMIVL
jgi:hypothetical protein